MVNFRLQCYFALAKYSHFQYIVTDIYFICDIQFFSVFLIILLCKDTLKPKFTLNVLQRNENRREFIEL